MEMLVSLLLLSLGFVMLVKGADWFVDGASGIAQRFGIPQIIIGLTIVAMGTSAPEAAVSITAARKGNADIAIGNIVGSNIFNILFVVGLSAIITPIPFSPEFYADSIVAVVAGAFLLICSMRYHKLHRPSGIAMVIGYMLYFVFICI